MATIILGASGDKGPNSDYLPLWDIYQGGVRLEGGYQNFGGNVLVTLRGDFTYQSPSNMAYAGFVTSASFSGSFVIPGVSGFSPVAIEMTGLHTWAGELSHAMFQEANVSSTDFPGYVGLRAAMLLYAGDDSFQGSAGADTMSGGEGDDTILGGAGNDLILNADGGLGQDLIRGEDGDDTIYGGADHDDINGNAGADLLRGGDGADWVVGGKDNDRLFGDAGDDIVYGNLGDDTVSGGDGNDWVRGGQGDDSLSGGAGADWMSGDKGNDTLSGGAGADTFNFGAGAGTDRVLDFTSAEGDRVIIEGSAAYTVAQQGADTVITLSGGADTLVLVGVTLSSLPAGWILAG